ncbi:MAG: histidinol-phosphate transaminase [Gaiellaceae bacterium]
MLGAHPSDGLFRPALAGLQPYEPGKPIEELQRELGLERVIKLASNEGPFGPFPEALVALERSAGELNRYPDGGAYRLRGALAEVHGVRAEEIALGAGADGVIDCVTQATLDPGDELVCGWPSFPSYVIYARRLGAVPRPIPLRGHRYDLDAILDAVGPRTKLVCISYPNNPTGTMNSRAELDAYFERVPEHVLTVLDQAYFEYLDDPDYVDGIEAYAKQGRRVLVLRTFSKIYGLAGLRIGYGVAAAPVVTAIVKVRRPFDLSIPAQEAALASIGNDAEIERRRRLNAEGRAVLERTLARQDFEVAGPAVANFVFAEAGEEAGALHEALLRLGVIVRPLGGFGAPTAIRVTVGTPEENEIFAEALAACRQGAL